MRKPDALVKEYAGRLSDDALKFLNSRLSQRLQGDLAEALDVLASSSDTDRLLNTAKSCNELYDLVDMLGKAVEKECVRRYGE